MEGGREPSHSSLPDREVEAGTPGGIRTHDPRIKNPLLCQLSYRRKSNYTDRGIGFKSV